MQSANPERMRELAARLLRTINPAYVPHLDAATAAGAIEYAVDSVGESASDDAILCSAEQFAEWDIDHRAASEGGAS